jgi:hypothetical protein
VNVTPAEDLEKRLKLMKQFGVTTYKDGILEIHMPGNQVPDKKRQTDERKVDLGKV